MNHPVGESQNDQVLKCVFNQYIMYMGVSKNRGTPKWMVKIMENPIQMDHLGGIIYTKSVSKNSTNQRNACF